MPTWSVVESDCIEAMRQMPENSYDAVICDPPYHLKSSKGGKFGFMGKTWDGGGIAFRPETWREVMRVAKPGAFLIAFGGTRTSHRLACAIEDAGWEIRDSILDILSADEKFATLCDTLTDEQRAALEEVLDASGLLAWVRGQGFPKAHDPALAIDKAFGHSPRGRAVPVASTHLPDGRYADEKLTGNPVGGYEPRTEEAERWAGFNIALRPLFEPIVLARKPLDGTIAANVLKWGTGVLNIGACRIGWPGGVAPKIGTPGWGGPHKSQVAWTKTGDVDRPRPPPSPSGRWPANLVLQHDSRCVLVGTRAVKGSRVDKPCPDPEIGGHRWGTLQGNRGPRGIGDEDGNEEVETWACVPGCPVRMLDDQAGVRKSGTGAITKATSAGYRPPGALGADNRPMGATHVEYGDSGPASRFFFCAKAARSEREAGLLGVVPCAKCGGLETTEHPNGRGGAEECVRCDHPTVKPLSLVSWIVRLATPPGGRVLDMFLGSGTTGAACMLEGFDFVGVDSDQRSVLIARARIAYAERMAVGKVAEKRKAKVARGDVPKDQTERQEQLGLLAGLDEQKEGT